MFATLRPVGPAPHAQRRTAAEPRLRRVIQDLLAGLRGGALLPA